MKLLSCLSWLALVPGRNACAARALVAVCSCLIVIDYPKTEEHK